MSVVRFQWSGHYAWLSSSLHTRFSYAVADGLVTVSISALQPTEYPCFSPSLARIESLALPQYIRRCTGISPYTNWQIGVNATATITMTVNTSSCRFGTTPLYFTHVLGAGLHYCLTGYRSIHLATDQSLTIHASNLCSFIVTDLWNVSQSFQWNVSWVGLA